MSCFFPREFFELLTALRTQRFPQGLILQNAHHLLSKIFGVSRIGEQGGLARHFSQGRDVRGNHQAAGIKSLQHGKPKAFLPGGVNEASGTVKKARGLMIREVARN
ncbi:MAG: hypothetical protein WC777_00400 [Candidatus Gracilibacteria bacterium]